MIVKYFQFRAITSVFKFDFIHSQNFSAVEIASEEDSGKENVSKGDLFSFWLL